MLAENRFMHTFFSRDMHEEKSMDVSFFGIMHAEKSEDAFSFGNVHPPAILHTLSVFVLQQ